MINSNVKVASFLKSKNMKLLESHVSKNFGDYYQVWGSNILELVLKRDRDQETIDVRKRGDTQTLYDLDLIQQYLKRVGAVNETEDLDGYNFLKENFDAIQRLFTDDCYPDLKREIELEEQERYRKMFPEIH